MTSIVGITECKGNKHQNQSESSSGIFAAPAVASYFTLSPPLDHACGNTKCSLQMQWKKAGDNFFSMTDTFF